MENLSQTLYILSTALFVPVLLGLLILTAWLLAALGGFAREFWERRQLPRARARWLPWLHGDGVPDPTRDLETFFGDKGAGSGYLAQFCKGAAGLRGHSLELNRLQDEIEIDVAARLSQLAFGARVGPMLGLMGTLIPLGPALIGLSEGRIDALASNLVVAFSTTVVGLLAGVVSFAMLHARRAWYARDLSLLEYICDCLEEQSGER